MSPLVMFCLSGDGVWSPPTEKTYYVENDCLRLTPEAETIVPDNTVHYSIYFTKVKNGCSKKIANVVFWMLNQIWFSFLVKYAWIII